MPGRLEGCLRWGTGRASPDVLPPKKFKDEFDLSAGESRALARPEKLS